MSTWSTLLAGLRARRAERRASREELERRQDEVVREAYETGDPARRTSMPDTRDPRDPVQRAALAAQERDLLPFRAGGWMLAAVLGSIPVVALVLLVAWAAGRG